MKRQKKGRESTWANEHTRRRIAVAEDEHTYRNRERKIEQRTRRKKCKRHGLIPNTEKEVKKSARENTKMAAEDDANGKCLRLGNSNRKSKVLQRQEGKKAKKTSCKKKYH